MKQVFNPYLPSFEYIPDAEPRVFDGRVYIYGSHDLFNGKNFCLGDYVTYSAPIDDLSSWRYEGVIFKKTQDPLNKKKRAFYAPDCIQGPDGKYYLYYSVNASGIIGVAKSDKPAGPFEFYSHVKYKDGTILGKKKGDGFQFDPGIYVEGDNIYLYSGFCPGGFVGFFVSLGKKMVAEGPLCIKLEKDMCTIKENPHTFGVRSFRNSKGTPYYGHEFFEASSLRKINNKYYFIYSSINGHELCYAISDYPDHDFKYGGTIVSNGDVGLGEAKDVKHAKNMTGNTHGSILSIGNEHYIFYHRQTNRNCFSRQACAEKINILEDGSIPQVAITSRGLNKEPLKDIGTYEARIACNLECKKGGTFYSVFKGRGRPYFTQSGVDREENPDQFITNISDETKVTFKDFKFETAKKIEIKLSSTGKGCVEVVDESNEVVAKFNILRCDKKRYFSDLNIKPGTHSLKFIFHLKGKVNFYSFTLS